MHIVVMCCFQEPKPKKKKAEKEPPQKAEKKEKDKGKAATSEGQTGPSGELMFQVGRHITLLSLVPEDLKAQWGTHVSGG